MSKLDLQRSWYMGMVSLVDEGIGNLTATLQRRNALDDTLLLFTSDHGDHLGAHGNREKMTTYDESLRVPFLLHWPARAAATVTDVTTSIDVWPTVAGLLGLPRPHADGHDLSPLLLTTTIPRGGGQPRVVSVRSRGAPPRGPGLTLGSPTSRTMTSSASLGTMGAHHRGPARRGAPPTRWHSTTRAVAAPLNNFAVLMPSCAARRAAAAAAAPAVPPPPAAPPPPANECVSWCGDTQPAARRLPVA